MVIRVKYVLQFSKRDDLQNTGSIRRLKIVELFGPVFLKLWEARRNETFHTKGGSRILKWGVIFCNNVREIKYYFNI